MHCLADFLGQTLAIARLIRATQRWVQARRNALSRFGDAIGFHWTMWSHRGLSQQTLSSNHYFFAHRHDVDRLPLRQRSASKSELAVQARRIDALLLQRRESAFGLINALLGSAGVLGIHGHLRSRSGRDRSLEDRLPTPGLESQGLVVEQLAGRGQRDVRSISAAVSATPTSPGARSRP